MVRALLIDDNDTDRLLAKRDLGQVFPGFAPAEVRDPRELDDAIRAGGFDLVVTDYQLNWSDGLRVLRAIKSRYPECPVIMFTGSGNEEVAVEAMKAGLDDYVVKTPGHSIRLATAARGAVDRADARRRAAVAEAERATLLARERAARAEAERLLNEAREADRRKDEFLAMLAHELRNPLAPIRNALHIMKLPGVTEDGVVRVRDMAERQVHHLSRLVDDLLDVSRVTTGKVTLVPDRLALADVLAAAVETARPLLDARRHTFEVAVPLEPLWVVGDATRLAQVFGNLLTNAAKYTPEGGHVRLTAERDGDRAAVRVRDNGLGISADLLPRVFDLFIQADRSLARSEGGLGVGLTLVRSLVEMHGGAVEAHSAGPGRGSEFVVRLPLAAELPPPAADPAAAAGGAPPGVPDPPRVLIVDDNVDAAESAGELLHLSGCEVRTVHDGPAAAAEAVAFRPRVVLLDIGLPGMNGYEVARRIRRELGREVVLVAVTGYGQDEDRRRAEEAGFDHHLVKPVAPTALIELIAGLAAPR